MPAAPGDSVFCWNMARNAVHAAMAGNTEMLIGQWHGRFVHVPLALATRYPQAGRRQRGPLAVGDRGDRASRSASRRGDVSGGANAPTIDLMIDVLVVPRASRTAVGPMQGDRLRVAVTAPPVDGEANAAVIDALAKAFGVRRGAIEIVRGERGRRKTIRIAGANTEVLARLRAGNG